MPTIPYKEQVRFGSAPNARAQVSGSALSGAASSGQGLVTAGNALQNASNDVFNIQQRIQKDYDESVTLSRVTDFENNLVNFTIEQEKRKGLNALGTEDNPSVIDATKAFMKSQVAELTKGMSVRQKNSFMDYHTKRTPRINAWGAKYQSGENDVYQEGVYTGFMSTQTQRAIQNRHIISEHMQATGTSKLLYYANARKKGVAEEAINAGWSKFREENIIIPTMETFLNDNDLTIASGFMKSHDGNLSETTKSAFGAKIRAKGEANVAKYKQQSLIANAGLRDNYNDMMAMINAGQTPENILSDKQITLAYGDRAEEAIEKRNLALSVLDDLNKMNNMTPTELNDFIEASEPKEQENFAQNQQGFEAKVRHAQSIIKQREEDPIKYLLSQNEETRTLKDTLYENFTLENAKAYTDAVKAEKEMLGVTDSFLLPKEDSKRISSIIENSENPAKTLAIFKHIFAKDYPKIQEQIAKENKQPMAIVFASSGMGEESAKIIIDASKNPNYIDEAKALTTNKDHTLLKTEIGTNLAPILKSFTAQGDSSLGAGLLEQTYVLAMHYLTKGYTEAESAEKAADEILLNRYHAYGDVRIPKNRQLNTVMAGINSTKSRLLNAPNSPIFLGDNNGISKEKATRGIKKGRFVTNADESGVIFFIGHKVAQDKDGKDIGYTWEELENMGVENMKQQEPNMPWF